MGEGSLNMVLYQCCQKPQDREIDQLFSIHLWVGESGEIYVEREREERKEGKGEVYP